MQNNGASNSNMFDPRAVSTGGVPYANPFGLAPQYQYRPPTATAAYQPTLPPPVQPFTQPQAQYFFVQPAQALSGSINNTFLRQPAPYAHALPPSIRNSSQQFQPYPRVASVISGLSQSQLNSNLQSKPLTTSHSEPILKDYPGKVRQSRWSPVKDSSPRRAANSNRQSHSRTRSRTRSPSRNQNGDRVNIKETRYRSRDRSRERSRDGSQSRERTRDRSRSRSRERTRERSRDRNTGYSRYRNNRDLDRDRDRDQYRRYDRTSSNRATYTRSDRPSSSRYVDSRSERSNDYRCNDRRQHDNQRTKRHNTEDNEKDNETAVKSTDTDTIAYIQTKSIPIYYTKEHCNGKTVSRGSAQLISLCEKFEAEMLGRSARARALSNSSEAAQIPDYRKLLLTKKFDNFTRCTCDSAQTVNDSGTGQHGCSQHAGRKKRIKAKNRVANTTSDSSTSSSTSDSEFNKTSSESSSSSSRSSSSSSRHSDSTSESGRRRAPKHDKEEEFDDIRSIEINRKRKHPQRLHEDLCFNEPDQTNEGPLCKCKLKNTTFGTRHQIYFGETPIPACENYCNNADRLFHYRMKITPFDDFKCKTPTSIKFDNNTYMFEGYSIFSHVELDNIPDCVVVIYNSEYKLGFAKEDMIENFTIKELELLKQFIFVEILELYDLKWKAGGASESCNCVHVMPRFCRPLPYNGKELLSPCEILTYLLSSSQPVISDTILAKCHQLTSREWLNYVEDMQGSIVTNPSKRPASIRLDQLDRDTIISQRGDKKATNSTYPLIIHFSMFRNTWLPMLKNNTKLKKTYQKYFKFRHLLNNKAKPTVEDKERLRKLGDQVQQMMKKSSEVHREVMVELTSEGFLRTGLRTDVVQQSVLLPTFIEHMRFHLSLKFLERKIGYTFKNRMLLQYALTHPSGALLLHQNLGSNPDHVRNTLFNCKVRNPNYGELTSQKRKSLLRKKGIHMLFQIMSQRGGDSEESSSICNYERLEYLGDKILEVLTSRHLFFLFPMYDEGQLSEYRNAIVQNQYLAVLARKLDLHYYILFYHGVDLCSNSALNHALANSFEALLAAIFLDSDLETVEAMLSKTLWGDDESTVDLLPIWVDLPLHPLQAQMPQGDRQLIPQYKILQHVQLFEETIGIEFNHIRLLAQAFCTRACSFNLITLGDNQRLEFLGDTVLNFVVSDYLYRFFPNHHEGHLSLLRSSLVCNSTQAFLYDELGMADYVLTSYINNRQESNGNLKRKADVFEAFVGALYIDQGLEAVTTFCHVCIFNKLQDIILYQFWNDPKSRLQQCCLSLRDVDESKPSLPSYKLIEEKGPPNHKQFTVVVYFNRNRIGQGIGKSIHDAEVEAAKNALETNADMFPVLNKYSTIEAQTTQNSKSNRREQNNGSTTRSRDHVTKRSNNKKKEPCEKLQVPVKSASNECAQASVRDVEDKTADKIIKPFTFSRNGLINKLISKKFAPQHKTGDTKETEKADLTQTDIDPVTVAVASSSVANGSPTSASDESIDIYNFDN